MSRLEPWGVDAQPKALLSPVLTAGMGKPQLERWECLGASAIPVPSWPRGQQFWESTHRLITKHPKELMKVLATSGLGRVGCVLVIAKWTC